MKITPDQISATLQKGLHPVYLVSGDEPLLCMEAVASISTAAENQGYSEKTHCLLEKEKDMDWFLEQGSTRSLFASKRILSLQLLSGKLGTKLATRLSRFLEASGDDTVLIISTPRLEKGTQSATWVKAIDNKGVWVTVWPISGSQFSGWLHSRLRGYGASISSDALAMLAEMCSGNMVAADQQAKKLSLLYPDKEISIDDLYTNGTDNSRFDVFQVIDSALLGKTAELLHSYNRASQEGLSPLDVLNKLTYQLRQLLTLSNSRDNGEPMSVASKKLRLWDARQRVYTDVLRRMSSQAILSLLRLCSRVDQQIKGGRASSGLQQSILALLLAVAGKKTPHLAELLMESEY